MRDWKKYFLVFGIAVLCFVLYYRETVASGFDLLPGDAGDGRLNVVMADSWRDYFSGRLRLGDTRIYHPFRGAQGFSDLNLSLFLMEVPFRLCGMDEARSAQAVCILLFFVGVMGMFHLCHKLFGISFPWSVVCALFAFLNNAFHLKQLHTQFYFLCLVPLLGICVFRYLELWESGPARRRIAYGLGAAAVFAAISYSNFYTAFFFALWFALFLAAFLAVRIRRDRVASGITWKKLGELAGLLAFLALLHVPFLFVYLPLVRSGFSCGWTPISGGLPVVFDVFNFGEKNLLWGGLYRRVHPAIHKGSYENTYGLPPFTLLLTAAVLLVWLRRPRNGGKRPAWQIAFVFAAAGIFAVTLKFFSNDSRFFPYTSLWYFFHGWLPGASAVRSMNRIYVFLMLPLAVFLGRMLTELERPWRRRTRIAFFCAVSALLMLDNFNLQPVANWRYSEYRKRRDAIAAPPPGCRVFFIAPESPGSGADWSERGLDAWIVAARFDLVTVNGYSGHFPPGWEPIRDVDAPEYMPAVDAWIREHSLTGVYMYDRRNNRWIRYDVP